MIIHQLIRHHLRHGDDDRFYVLQAEDAVRWMAERGLKLGRERACSISGAVMARSGRSW